MQNNIINLIKIIKHYLFKTIKNKSINKKHVLYYEDYLILSLDKRWSTIITATNPRLITITDFGDIFARPPSFKKNAPLAIAPYADFLTISNYN